LSPAGTGRCIQQAARPDTDDRQNYRTPALATSKPVINWRLRLIPPASPHDGLERCAQLVGLGRTLAVFMIFTASTRL
jgi:hypothetical protein